MPTIIVKCPACGKGLKVSKSSDDQPIVCGACKYRSVAAEFEQVALKKVLCPKCKAEFAVTAEYQGNAACPECKYRSDINSFSGANADPNKTQIGTSENLLKPCVLILQSGECQPAKIVLKRGVNIIGRKSQAGEGVLQTADRYISKKHFIIDVVMKPDYTFEHRLSDAGSTNGTFHNDSKLEVGEIVVLAAGDTVKIGQTVFRLAP